MDETLRLLHSKYPNDHDPNNHSTRYIIQAVGITSFVMNLIAVNDQGNIIDSTFTMSYGCNTRNVNERVKQITKYVLSYVCLLCIEFFFFFNLVLHVFLKWKKKIPFRFFFLFIFLSFSLFQTNKQTKNNNKQKITTNKEPSVQKLVNVFTNVPVHPSIRHTH